MRHLFFVLLFILFHGQTAYAGLAQSIRVNLCDGIGCGPVLVGAARLDFNAGQPVGVTWGGSYSNVSLSVRTQSPFGGTGQITYDQGLNKWWFVTLSRYATLASAYPNSKELGLYFSPDETGYFSYVSLAEVSYQSQRDSLEAKLEGFGVADNSTDPVLKLNVDVVFNSQSRCAGEEVLCQLEVDDGDMVLFRVKPYVNSNIANIILPDSSQLLAAIPENSAMKSAAQQNFSIDLTNPQAVLDKYGNRYIRTMMTTLGQGNACGGTGIGAFNTVALRTTPDSLVEGNYLDNTTEAFSSITGCGAGYQHIVSPEKSYDIRVTRTENAATQGDYVDYIFYVVGHYNPANTALYPGSHKTIRLYPKGTGGGTNPGQTNASLSISGSTTVARNESFTLTAEVTNVSAPVYEWDISQADGVEILSATTTEATLLARFADLGQYTFQVTVTSPSDATVNLSQSHSVTVDTGEPPTITSITRVPATQTVQSHDAVKFTANATDPDGNNTISRYTWTVQKQQGSSFMQASSQDYIISPGTSTTSNTATITFKEATTSGTTYRVQVVAKDKTNRSSQAQVSDAITVIQAPNSAPTADFSMSTNSGSAPLSVTLYGNASDPDGDTLTYDWQISPSSYSEEPAERIPGQTKVVLNNEGTYTISLKVTDSGGKSATSGQKTITVGPQQQTGGGPVAAFTVTKAASNTVQLNSSSSQGGSLTRFWSISPASYKFGFLQGPNTLNPEVTFLANGNYTVTLRVTDSQGQSDTKTETVNASGADLAPPVAAFAMSATEISAGGTVQLNANGSTGAQTYTWSVTPSPGTTIPNTATPTVTFNTPGTYNITLTVTDSANQQNSTAKQVIVKAPEGPTAGFTISNVNPGADEFILLNAGDKTTWGDAKAPSANPAKPPFSWSSTGGLFGDGEVPGSATGNAVRVKYPQGGTYTITLTVTDALGQQDTEETTVTVADSQGPTAGFSIANTAPGINDAVRLNAIGETIQGDAALTATSFAWSSEDAIFIVEGEEFTGNAQWHAPFVKYGTAGVHNITLTVTDGAGLTDAITKTLTVQGAQGPRAGFSISNAMPETGDRIQLDVANPDADPEDQTLPGDAALASFTWTTEAGGVFLQDGIAITGNTTSGNAVWITYPQAGTYEITLMVTDVDGLSDTQTQSIVVNMSELPEWEPVWEYGFGDETGIVETNAAAVFKGGVRNTTSGEIYSGRENNLIRAEDRIQIPTDTEVDITVSLEVAEDHKGIPGRVVILAMVEWPGIASGLFNLSEFYGFVPWDIATLSSAPPFFEEYKTYEQLPATPQTIPVYKGTLPVGSYALYVGYIPADDSGWKVYFSGTQFSAN